MSGDGYRYLLNERAFRGLNIQKELHLQKADTTFPATNALLHIADNEGAVGFSEARLTTAGSLRLPGTFDVTGSAAFDGAVSIYGETTLEGRLNATGNVEVLGNLSAYSAVTVNGDIKTGGLIKSTRIAGYPYSRYESPFDGLKLTCDSANPSTMLWRQTSINNGNIGYYDGTLGNFEVITSNIVDAAGNIYTPTNKVGLTWICSESGLYTITVTLIGRILSGGGTEGAVFLTNGVNRINPPFTFNNSSQFQTISIPITLEVMNGDGISLITDQVGATPSVLELRAGSAITFLRHC